MRVKSFAITLVVLAIGAAPAVAAKENALRAVPRPARVVVKPAVWMPAPTKPAVWMPAPTKPAAVWIPTPRSGIKWAGGGVRIAVRVR